MPPETSPARQILDERKPVNDEVAMLTCKCVWVSIQVQIALLALLLGGNFLYNHGLIHNWWGSNEHYGYQFLQVNAARFCG